MVARGEAVDEQDVAAAGTRTADGDPGPIPEAGEEVGAPVSIGAH